MILPSPRAGSWHRQGEERRFHWPPRKIIPRTCQKHHFSGEEEEVPKGFVINSLQLSRKLSTCKMSRSGKGFTSLTTRLTQAGARRHAASKRVAGEAVQGVQVVGNSLVRLLTSPHSFPSSLEMPGHAEQRLRPRPRDKLISGPCAGSRLVVGTKPEQAAPPVLIAGRAIAVQQLAPSANC